VYRTATICTIRRDKNCTSSDIVYKERERKLFKYRPTQNTSDYRDGSISEMDANNESSEVIDISLPVTLYFHPSTRFDVENFWRFIICELDAYLHAGNSLFHRPAYFYSLARCAMQPDILRYNIFPFLHFRPTAKQKNNYMHFQKV